MAPSTSWEILLAHWNNEIGSRDTLNSLRHGSEWTPTIGVVAGELMAGRTPSREQLDAALVDAFEQVTRYLRGEPGAELPDFLTGEDLKKIRGVPALARQNQAEVAST